MSAPRKHHFLPQFYLRGFSEDNKTIAQIEKITGKNYRCSIKDAAAIRDYHELDHPEIEDPNILEKKLSEIETQSAINLSNIINNGIVSGDAHKQLIEFVSMMRIRVPAFKNYIEKSLMEAVRTVGKIMDRKGALPPRPEGFEEDLSFDNLIIDISNWKCLEFMYMFAANAEILELMGSMQPKLLRTPSGATFITCDQPVSVYNSAASKESVYGFGLMDKRTEISFPLSRNVLLHLVWSTESSEDRLSTFEEVEEFNRRTIIMSESLVFAPLYGEEITTMVAKYSKCFAGMELNVIDTGQSAYHISRFKPVMKKEKYE